MLRFMKRKASEFTSVDTIRCLFRGLCTSRLEYWSVIWNPYYAKYVHQIDSIQKKFLKFLQYFQFRIYLPINREYSPLLILFDTKDSVYFILVFKL